MIRAMPFSVAALHSVKLQPEQRLDSFDIHVATNGNTWVFVDASGKSLAVGGLYPVADHMAIAWAFVGCDVKRHMAALALRAREILAQAEWPVVRAGVLVGFKAGERLVRLLGFERLDCEPITYGPRVYNVFERVRS